MFSLLRRIHLYIVRSYFFRYFLTELKYIFVGMSAILDDIAQRKKNKCKPIKLTGKVALVTGGARGLGSDVVKKLLECDIHVIVGCRNTRAGGATLENIRRGSVTSGSCHVFELDLASFTSIRKFAIKVFGVTDKLHILVNNAGIMFPPYIETESGYESQWCVNYLGPFLLTHLLFPLISKASSVDECRIINVSSCAHKLCSEIDYPALNDESIFITGIAYACSKAAQVLFTLHLNNLCKRKGLNISVFAVHPGIVNTDLFNGTAIKVLMPWVFKYLCKDTDGGATSVFYPCVSPNLNGKNGLYLSNCRISSPSKFTQTLTEQNILFSFTLNELRIHEFGNE